MVSDRRLPKKKLTIYNNNNNRKRILRQMRPKKRRKKKEEKFEHFSHFATLFSNEMKHYQQRKSVNMFAVVANFRLSFFVPTPAT